MLARRLGIMLQHVPQHQRIADAVRQMVKAAERVGERMHPGDRRVGERQAGEMRAEQHRRSRIDVRAARCRRSADCAVSSRSASRASASDIGFLSRAEV